MSGRRVVVELASRPAVDPPARDVVTFGPSMVPLSSDALLDAVLGARRSIGGATLYVTSIDVEGRTVVVDAVPPDAGIDRTVGTGGRK